MLDRDVDLLRDAVVALVRLDDDVVVVNHRLDNVAANLKGSPVEHQQLLAGHHPQPAGRHQVQLHAVNVDCNLCAHSVRLQVGLAVVEGVDSYFDGAVDRQRVRQVAQLDRQVILAQAEVDAAIDSVIAMVLVLVGAEHLDLHGEVVVTDHAAGVV